MTQRSIEMVIGRLTTDEDFRRRFANNPQEVLVELQEWGIHLTHVEIAALMSMDVHLWEDVAGHIDPRLQKASLKSE